MLQLEVVFFSVGAVTLTTLLVWVRVVRTCGRCQSALCTLRSDGPAGPAPQDLEQLVQAAAAWSERGQLLEYQLYEIVTALLPEEVRTHAAKTLWLRKSLAFFHYHRVLQLPSAFASRLVL